MHHFSFPTKAESENYEDQPSKNFVIDSPKIQVEWINKEIKKRKNSDS